MVLHLYPVFDSAKIVADMNVAGWFDATNKSFHGHIVTEKRLCLKLLVTQGLDRGDAGSSAGRDKANQKP